MLGAQIQHAVKLAIRRSPWAPVLRSLFRKKPLDPALARGRRDGWEAAARWLLSEGGRAVLAQPAIHAALRSDINQNLDTELLLTALRRDILISGMDPEQRPALRPLVFSLVQQCINNDYVWFVSQEEKELLRSSSVSWGTLAVLAMYQRLEDLLPAGAGGQVRWPSGAPAEWVSLVESYLSDYREEASYRPRIATFAAITRKESQLVASRYEGHPYPKWLTWEMTGPVERRRQLAQFFSADELAFLEEPFEMLVAGCGTGAKAIAYASCYRDRAKILAIDLSRASLAYAMRMARKHGVSNIEFIQMDLHELPHLGRSFDLVECTGVLHHLPDPVAGGRALVSVVRPGGLANISLYSELARREIVRLRALHRKPVADYTDDEVREFRWRLMHDDPATINERLPLRWDFFDLRRCRDLLFHPLEHRFTLPAVGRFLEAVGLTFRGLERPGLPANKFWTRFPAANEQSDPARWHEFELKNPDAFGSLYDIWAIKPDGSAL